MSEAQKQAQQERRAREKERVAQAAANAAEAAAESIPDSVEPQSGDDEPRPRPKVDHSARQEMLESLRNKPEDMDEYIRSETNEPESETVAEATPEPETPAETVPETPAAPEMVTVKIDGQESQVSKAEVDSAGGVAQYQMLKASERRYEQANREKQEMAQLLAQARQLIEANQKPKEPDKTPDELIRERVTQIQLGTPEEAAQAIKDILQANTPKQLDPVALANYVSDQVAQKGAAQRFIQRNSDLLQNPYFGRVAAFMEGDKLSKSRPSDWDAFYINLESEFRNGLGKPAITQAPSDTTQQTGQPTSGTVADKLARKADIVNLPVAGARVQAKEEPKPLSREDRINLMRKTRGQPVG